MREPLASQQPCRARAGSLRNHSQPFIFCFRIVAHPQVAQRRVPLGSEPARPPVTSNAGSTNIRGACMTLASLKRQRGLLLLAAAFLFFALTAWAQDDGTDTLNDLKHPDTGEGLSAGAEMARFGPVSNEGPGSNPQPGLHDHGRGGNTFVNDPCIDPPPPNRQRTVQSETEIAVFGKYMVTGYNDSFGFYDNTQGLSGYSYSVDGGNTWIDGSGLPPVIPGGAGGSPGHDTYFGDPVLVVDKSARAFAGQ